MSVQIAGVLLDPYGEIANFAEIQFITLQGAGEVMTTAPAVYKTSADGSYSINVQFGVFAVLMRYNQSNGKFQQIKKVIVNSSTVATTLGELLLNNEPLTPPEIAYVEQLVAEAKEYRDESEAFAIASEASSQSSAVSAAESAQSAIDAANSAALIAPIPLNGGVWASGQTYDFYNQYMIYNGEAYSPLPATILPYTVGAAPDLNFVYQIKLNDHAALANRDALNSHSASSITGVTEMGLYSALSIDNFSEAVNNNSRLEAIVDKNTVPIGRGSTMFLKGFDHTGVFGSGRDGIPASGVTINAENGQMSATGEYLSCLTAYSATVIPSNWSVNNVRLTTPNVPDKSINVFPGLGRADDHFAYVNRGGKNHIVSGVRTFSDNGISHMFGDVGVDAARMVENGVYSDVIMEGATDLGLQVDSSKYGVFNNFVIRGFEFGIPPSLIAGTAYTHAIRMLAQQGINGAECTFNRIDNFVIADFTNGAAMQTGAKNNCLSYSIDNSYSLLSWQSSAASPTDITSIRNNDVDVNFRGTVIGTSQSSCNFNRIRMTGEGAGGLVSQTNPKPQDFDTHEHSDFDILAHDISQNAAGFKTKLSRIALNLKGGLSNATNRPFIIDADTSRCHITGLISEFNQPPVFSASYNIVDLIQDASGPLDMGGFGNILRRVDPSTQCIISGSYNIVQTHSREVRDTASASHNILTCVSNATDAAIPVILSGSRYTMNLSVSSAAGLGTSVSIGGSHSSGSITARNVNSVCASITGDNNALVIAAERSDENDALVVGGNENVIQVSSNGVVRVTGANNVISGVCRSFVNTGSGNDMSALKQVP